MKKNLFIEIVSFLLVLLFTYAACSKLLDYRIFVFQLGLSPFYPIKILSGLLAWAVPLLELGIVTALLFSRTRVYGLLASLVLLSLFEVYIAAMLLSGWDLPCTCGGIIARLTWKQHLLFNGSFIILTAITILNYDRQKVNINNSSTFSRV